MTRNEEEMTSKEEKRGLVCAGILLGVLRRIAQLAIRACLLLEHVYRTAQTNDTSTNLPLFLRLFLRLFLCPYQGTFRTACGNLTSSSWRSVSSK